MFHNKKNNPEFIEFLSEKLWPAKGVLRRLSEFSPLYVSRYVGPRTQHEYTTHEYFELLCVMRGRGEFFQEGRQGVKLQKGVVLLIPCGMKHYEFSEGQLDTIWIGVTGRRVEDLSCEPVLGTQAAGLCDYFEQLYFEAKRQNIHCGAVLDSLTTLIITKLLSKQSLECSGGIQQAMRYLHDNFDQQISFSQLAYDLGYSEGYFYRLFKKNCNMTPGEFLAKVRIEHAIEMIHRTSLPFIQIAERCGIGDGQYFSRLIKNMTGHSPRDLRKLLR